MFGNSSLSKYILALLLPLAFVLSWAACESVCAEITEQHDHQTVISEKYQHGENCLGLTDKTEGCKMTATVAVLQERQTVKASALAVAALPVLQFRAPNRAWSALLPEIKQNSPPPSLPTLLFVLLCTFRI